METEIRILAREKLATIREKAHQAITMIDDAQKFEAYGADQEQIDEICSQGPTLINGISTELNALLILMGAGS